MMQQQNRDRPRQGGGFYQPDTRTDFRFDDKYLKGGYFSDAKRENLRPELLDTVAMDVAKRLINSGINSYQLRRFYNQVRAIERSVGTQRSFEAAKADIVALKSAVAYQVGRGLVREDFKRFIDRNADLAKENADNLTRGFIPHFGAVLGFFVYLKPDERGFDRRR
ncbi:MAG: type III-A CRISPR-associated protein Csm2 [Chloroflexota bacterium]|nr:MAG: type III-A CRISPR-associated protein Csm2 [Chloroflexota bacterium]